MLESYLLGLFCPSEQQQWSNQAAAVQAVTLAVQGAARVMHVSTAAHPEGAETTCRHSECCLFNQHRLS